MENHINRSPSPFLTFLFSLLPGAGHMYLGLMRRGIEIMLAFFGSIFIIANTLRLGELGVPLSIVIFFYSLFDALHLGRSIRRGEDVEDNNFIKISNQAISGYHMGIGIMIIGLLFLLDRLRIYAYPYISPQLYGSLERSIAPLLIMGIGIYLIIKSRKTEEKNSTAE